MRTNRFDFDKGEWQWESASKIYRKRFGKSVDELTEDDKSVIWENGANHISLWVSA